MNKELKIIEIIHKVYKFNPEKATKSENLDLLSGVTGYCLFLNNYEDFFEIPNEKSKLIYLVNNIFKDLEKIQINYSLMYGLAGFCFMLENSIILKNSLPIDFMLHSKNNLIKAMHQKLLVNDFDYFTGYLGIGYYLTNSLFLSDSEKYEIFKKILIALHSSKFENENGWFWINRKIGSECDSHFNKLPIVNLGIAHGQMAIVRFILTAEKVKDEDLKLLNELLKNSIKFIINSKLPDPKYGLLFPSHQYDMKLENTFYQPGWCYGDMTFAILLFKASILLSDNSYKNLAIEISNNLYYKLLNVYQNETNLSLCHGLPAFINLSKSFLKLSKQREYFEIVEKLNFNLINTIEKSEILLTNNYGLMYGFSGIGLTLLDELDNRTHCLIKKLLI